MSDPDGADEKTRFVVRDGDETRVVVRQDERTTLRRAAPVPPAAQSPAAGSRVADAGGETEPPTRKAEVYGIRPALVSESIRNDFTVGRPDAPAAVPPIEQRIAARRKQRRAGLGAVVAVALTAVGSLIVIIVGIGFIAGI